MRVGCALAAVAGPLVLSGLAFRSLSAPLPWAPSLRVQAQDAAVRRDPDVVVLGSSYALSDIAPARLAAALGQPGLEVALLATPGSPSAVWYAALHERVYAAGGRPRLVLVVATMGTLLQGVVPSGAVRHLREQGVRLTGALAAKAGVPAADDAVATALAQRATLRDAALAPFRSGLVGLLYGGDGATTADAASATVFAAQQAAGASAPGRLLPVVEEGDDDPDANFRSTVDDPAESFLPELVTLARAHGAQVVVVLPPTAAGHLVGQYTSPAAEDATLRWAHAHGIGWVDLRDAAYPTSAFRDGRHMNARGAARFSDEAGAALVELGALAGAVRPPDLPATATREPAPPHPGLIPAATRADTCRRQWLLAALPPIDTASLFADGAGGITPLRVRSGEATLAPAAKWSDVTAGCTGTWGLNGRSLRVSLPSDAAPEPVLGLADEAPLRAHGRPPSWWVYPGGALRWDWPTAPLAGRVRVDVRVHPVGAGSGAFTLDAGPDTVVLTRDVRGDHVGSVELAAPTSLRVRSTADAPFALVTTLGLTDPQRTVYVVRPVEGRTVAAPIVVAAGAPGTSTFAGRAVAGLLGPVRRVGLQPAGEAGVVPPVHVTVLRGEAELVDVELAASDWASGAVFAVPAPTTLVEARTAVQVVVSAPTAAAPLSVELVVGDAPVPPEP